MRISTGNVIGPRYKIRLLRIRFTPLERPERSVLNPECRSSNLQSNFTDRQMSFQRFHTWVLFSWYFTKLLYHQNLLLNFPTRVLAFWGNSCLQNTQKTQQKQSVNTLHTQTYLDLVRTITGTLLTDTLDTWALSSTSSLLKLPIKFPKTVGHNEQICSIKALHVD